MPAAPTFPNTPIWKASRVIHNHPNNKKTLYSEQGGYCFGCAHHFWIQGLSIAHIIPKSKGGTDHISNLQLLCGSCNSIKGDKTQEELIVRLIDKVYIKRANVV